MTLDDTSSISDVSTSGDSSVSDSSAPSEQNTQEAVTQDVSSNDNTEGNLPFNDPRSPMHSRFKELHEQATSYRAELERERQERAAIQQEYEKRFQELQQRIPKPQEQKPFQPLLERLKGIDPEFASFQEKALQAIEELPRVTQQLQQYQIERDRSTAQQTLSSLYDQFKVPEERREDYQARLEAMAYNNPKLSLKDLPNAFKSIHESVSKRFDTYERKIRESYVKEKKADATPATQTGGAATSGKAQKKAMSRDDVRSQLVQAMRSSNKKI